MSSPENFLRELPPVTRTFSVLTFLVTLGVVFQFLNYDYLYLNWFLVYQRNQYWRLITEFFFVGPFSIAWLFHIYFFVQYASKLEKHPCFSGGRVDKGAFLYFLVLQMLLLDSISLLFYATQRGPLLGLSLNFAIIYYWSKVEAFIPINFWGFTIKAWQLPYALLALNVLMGQTPIPDLMGLLSGHIYYFLRDVLPVEQNVNILSYTPSFFGLVADKLDFFKERQPNRPAYHPPQPTQPPVQRSINRISTLFDSATSTFHNNRQFPGTGYSIRDGLPEEAAK